MFTPQPVGTVGALPGLDDRESIVAYVRLVASRFQSYGLPEKHGQARADEMTAILTVLADDIEDSADRDDI